MAENRKQNPPLDDEAQSKRFIEVAKQLEVDKTGKLFENAVGVVVSSAPRAGPHRQESETQDIG